MKTIFLTVIMIVMLAIHYFTKPKVNELPIKIKPLKEVKQGYIYKKSDNHKTNYLEKEDSLNLVNA